MHSTALLFSLSLSVCVYFRDIISSILYVVVVCRFFPFFFVTIAVVIVVVAIESWSTKYFDAIFIFYFYFISFWIENVSIFKGLQLIFFIHYHHLPDKSSNSDKRTIIIIFNCVIHAIQKLLCMLQFHRSAFTLCVLLKVEPRQNAFIIYLSVWNAVQSCFQWASWPNQCFMSQLGCVCVVCTVQ